jgi:hypothetical protein
LFAALSSEECSALPPQNSTLGDALWAFIQHQQEALGNGYSHKLEGMLGGDGDWARETLAFGFMVENAYQGVYRIWSRAWLVTK